MKVPHANWFAPPGSNRSSSGGNEAAEASGVEGRFRRFGEFAGRNDSERCACPETDVLQRFVVLFFIELSTRKVEIAGIATNANGLWMSQIGRNLTDAVDALLTGKRCLIHDRDPLFTGEFLGMLAGMGVKSVNSHRGVRT